MSDTSKYLSRAKYELIADAMKIFNPDEPPINFYRLNEPYGCFSNFWLSPVKIDGRIWTTTEHYYQAMKMVSHHDVDKIHDAPTPKQAATLGRTLTMRQGWEHVRNGFMFTALIEKFSQHHDLREILILTKDRELIEHTKNDSYWGDGGDGSGRNTLGFQLMVIRHAFKEAGF